MTILNEKFVLNVPPYYYKEAYYNERLIDFIENNQILNSRTLKVRFIKKSLIKSIKLKRSNKIYNMHTYWSKKPHQIIQNYINYYSNKGDIILDPFCGSGGTLLAASLCRRQSIGIDISPAATFFTATLCSQPVLSDFIFIFTKIMNQIRQKFSWIYEIPYGSQNRTIHFGISSLQIKCKNCSIVNTSYELKANQSYRCSQCQQIITSNQEKSGYILHELHLKAGHGKHIIIKPSLKFRQFEINLEHKIKLLLTEYTPPRLTFPKNGRTQVLSVRGINNLVDLYTPRNLLALCLFRNFSNNIQDPRLRRALLYVLTACCLKSSRLMGLNADGIGRIQKNGLIAQLIVKDVNVFDFLEIAFKNILGGFKAILDLNVSKFDIMISNQSAVKLDNISDCTIDYIFTDPPYGEKVQFWESNQIWEAWLGFKSDWKSSEIIINKTRNLNVQHWKSLMKFAMKECYRVLKPNRHMTLTYNDPKTFLLLQDIMHKIGFVSEVDTIPVFSETTAKSEKQLKNEKNLTKDMIITFYKPFYKKNTESKAFNVNNGIKNLVYQILIEHPGSSNEFIIQMFQKSINQKEIQLCLRAIAEEIPKQSDKWYISNPILTDLNKNS